jgi:nucleotide-binding universal stress UspA family protein
MEGRNQYQREATTPVRLLDIGRSSPTQIRHILAAIDGSDHAEKAGLFAVGLAKRYDARLFLLHVAHYPPQYLGRTNTHDVAVGFPPQNKDAEVLKKKSTDSMDRIGETAQRENVLMRKEILDTPDSIVDSIADYAERESVQIIVVGIRGLSNFDPYVAGSVASGLLTRARCSLLIVR